MPRRKKTENPTATIRKNSAGRQEEKIAIERETSSKRFFPTRPTRRTVVLLLIVLLVSSLIYLKKGLFIAAIVDNKPVTRAALIQELEKRYGRQTLDALVTEILIQNEAQKEKITIDQSEIETEIKKIEDSLSKSGQKLDDALALQRSSRKELTGRIKTQALIEKMLKKDLNVSDSEIEEFIKKNKDTLPKDKKPEETKEEVRRDLMQQKMEEKFPSWLEDLRTKAKINYFLAF